MTRPVPTSRTRPAPLRVPGDPAGHTGHTAPGIRHTTPTAGHAAAYAAQKPTAPPNPAYAVRMIVGWLVGLLVGSLVGSLLHTTVRTTGGRPVRERGSAGRAAKLRAA